MTEVYNFCCQNKAVRYLTSDRISNLPNDVIDNILMRLPIRVAARTSILSKSWRQRWAHIPNIVLDDDFLGVLQSTSCGLIMKRVYEVLLLHCGPLRQFVLSVTGLKSCPEIDLMIFFLSKKDIHVLTLQISNSEQHYHRLPSCLFSYLQLRYLKLRYFIFKPPPSFKGFDKLQTLYFERVRFDADFFKNFISSCPLLANLTLNGCTAISCLEFNAPNLKLLRYYGTYRSICFKNTPHLETVCINQPSGADPQYGRGKISNLIEVFSCLPALKALSVDDYVLKTFAFPDTSMRIQATWNHLKLLDIRLLRVTDFCFVEKFLGALSLLRNSPNLRELVMQGFHDQHASTNWSLQFLESDTYMDFSLNQLQRVVFEHFIGTRLQMELVKLLLAKSSALKVMHIKIHAVVVADLHLKILKDLLRAKRASLEVEIICENL